MPIRDPVPGNGGMKTIRAMLPALAVIVGAGMILGGCAYNTDDPMAMRGKPYKPYIVGAPYQVDGHWYYPREDYAYDRVGIASWYGPDFDGHRTANGEIYDMDLMTAAHPSLPMPSLVSVTNLANGRSVVVRINDRGPFVGNRIIDLSRRAAEELRLKRRGVGRVRVRILRTASLRLKHQALAALGRIEERKRRDEVAARSRANQKRISSVAANPGPVGRDRVGRDRVATSTRIGPVDQADAQRLNKMSPGAGPTSVGRPIPLHPGAPRVRGIDTPGAGQKRVFIQVGSFSHRSNALRTGERLRGIAQTRIAVRRIDDAVFYRVRVGPVASRQAGRALLSRIRRKGYTEARIVVR